MSEAMSAEGDDDVLLPAGMMSDFAECAATHAAQPPAPKRRMAVIHADASMSNHRAGAGASYAASMTAANSYPVSNSPLTSMGLQSAGTPHAAAAQLRLAMPLSAFSSAHALPVSASEQWQPQGQAQPPLWQPDPASSTTAASPSATGGGVVGGAYDFGRAFEPLKLYTARLATAAQRTLLNTSVDTVDATVVVMVLLNMARRQPHVLAPFPGLSDLLLSYAGSTPDMTTFLAQPRATREMCTSSDRTEVPRLLHGTFACACVL
ncbi:hypothetical protein EON62_03655 [archaeon]|nr:MAG: hypothetical protein EON62_03655 [archaeon]